MRQEGEPSVEEILDSIKKVIARDNRDSAALDKRRREAPVAEREPEEAPAEAEEVLDLGQADMVEEAAQPESPLINSEATRSMRESLAALAMIAEPGAQPQIVRSGETSLESLTRELLRPMLAQWLDTNLPPLVERLVKEEITRIAGKKG